MVEQYGRVRRFCPHYCAICTSGRPQTVNIPRGHPLPGRAKRLEKTDPGRAPEHIISGPWKRLVYDAEGRYSERVTRCVCWSDFRMRYAA